jgi:glycogen synthase
VLGKFGEADYTQSIYPPNDWDAIRVYARVAAAMANYIKMTKCDALHLHDYHLGLIPFYLDMEALGSPGVVFTIHNATYQGWLEIWNDPAPVMYELSLPLKDYYDYFQHWRDFNTLKGILLKVAEVGGAVTTVSQGYARELCMTEDDLRNLAVTEGCPMPKKVFVPSLNLAEFTWVGVMGIDNGLSDENRPENMKFFKAAILQNMQQTPLFRHPMVQEEMLKQDHNYSRSDLNNRWRLKELLCLECFGGKPEDDDIIFCAIGRLVHQKNFNVLLGCMEPIIHHHPNVHFIIQAASSRNDIYGEAHRQYFTEVAERNPNNVFFYPKLNDHPQLHEALGKLVLAGSDFCIIPSRFEPCGLVDYEAAVLGNIPIVRKTGGLAKTLPHAYSYSWYNEEDPWGESLTLSKVIERAIEDFMYYPTVHQKRVLSCMDIDTSWEKAVSQYLRILRITEEK